MPLVVHPHFHPRRTGVTRHVEAMVRALPSPLEARAVGRTLEADVPRLSWRELWRRARHEGLVWHAHRNHELLAGLLLRALLGRRRVRVVFTRHAMRPGRYTRLLAARADARVAMNAPMAAQLGGGARVVGHGVDTTRFSPPEDRAAVWAALGQGGQRGVGVVGRVRPAKGQGDFVEALAPLLSAHPDWRAVLVGGVHAAEAAWAEGLRQKSGGAVALLGERADVARWYQGLTVLVQPSHSEGYSMVLLEAMAAGCCVVAARLPYSEDALEDGRTGFLYPPGDVEALRRILALLLAAPARAEAVGRAAAEAARTRFTLQHEARELAGVYAGLSGGASSGASPEEGPGTQRASSSSSGRPSSSS